MSLRCLLALSLLVGCDGETTPKDAMVDDGFDRAGLLAHLGGNVLLPMQEGFEQAGAALPTAIEAHCNALDAGTPGTTLDAARAAFGASVDAWQRPDAVLVGPAAKDMKSVRGWIYGWPNLTPCEIDRDVASRWSNPSSYDIAREFVSTRSLFTIEYLLYPQSNMHNCVGPPTGWDGMVASSELARARCRLAQAIATDVAAQGATLAATWRDVFVGDLASAGTSGSTFATAHEALNQISDGMFYVDKMVKDMKLGEAAGIALNGCDAVQSPCFLEVELRASDRATFAIRANLQALRNVFTGDVAGTAGIGFDDWIIFAGHSDLAARMVTNLDAAIAKANALPDSFLTALNSNYADVAAVHSATKLFTDDLKSQFLTVLALEIPNDAATDND